MRDLLRWRNQNCLPCEWNNSKFLLFSILLIYYFIFQVIFRLDNEIVTAGEDGFIKFWNFEKIDQAEGDDYGNFFIKPTNEIRV